MTGPLADIINPAKFYLNRIRGFDSVEGSNFWLSHKKEKSPLTQGLNYRSAYDAIPRLHDPVLVERAKVRLVERSDERNRQKSLKNCAAKSDQSGDHEYIFKRTEKLR